MWPRAETADLRAECVFDILKEKQAFLGGYIIAIELKKLSPDDGRDIYDMLQAIPKNENGRADLGLDRYLSMTRCGWRRRRHTRRKGLQK